jgi:hypothetical protein
MSSLSLSLAEEAERLEVLAKAEGLRGSAPRRERKGEAAPAARAGLGVFWRGSRGMTTLAGKSSSSSAMTMERFVRLGERGEAADISSSSAGTGTGDGDGDGDGDGNGAGTGTGTAGAGGCDMALNMASMLSEFRSGNVFSASAGTVGAGLTSSLFPDELLLSPRSFKRIRVGGFSGVPGATRLAGTTLPSIRSLRGRCPSSLFWESSRGGGARSPEGFGGREDG